MRVLVAPQEFKGTLTALEAAAVMERAIRDARPDAEIDVAPLADGGPGTVDVFLRARGGSERWSRVHDPLGRSVDARWAVLEDGTAAIELAAASGLSLLAPSEYDALGASSRGAGELVRAALDAGCARVLLGLGGSATSDGGAGALSALGVRFLDAEGAELGDGGAELARLAEIDRSGLAARLARTPVTLLTDVHSALLGATGAARMFSAQKGASPEEVERLESALAHFAAIADPTGDIASSPGAGAAGGTAFGFAALIGARIKRGFDAIADALDLDSRIRRADLVVTGEGRLDAQSAQGKGPAALAERVHRAGKPVLWVVGTAEPESQNRFDFAEIAPLFDVAPAFDTIRKLSESRIYQAVRGRLAGLR